jgi:plastocyanin
VTFFNNLFLGIAYQKRE